MKKVLLGNEAIVKGAIEAGVSYVTGYPGCPSAEIGQGFLDIAKKENIYAEWAVNEKVALESAIGASFSGLKTLVNMKSFGINVCSDSLLPLAYTGTKGAMVIVVADDPSGHSSAQSEQDSRGYSLLSHIPTLEPADPQECYEFTKLGFEISEKFNMPVILRITTRVAHQRAIVEFASPSTGSGLRKIVNFLKNPHQFCTMTPRVLEMKKELIEKIEKIRAFAEKSKANRISGRRASAKLGVITYGVSHLHFMEAEKEMGLDLPVLKLGFFYPLPSKKIKAFLAGCKKVLVIEELEGHIEREVKIIANNEGLKTEILGKNLLPEIGELNTEKVGLALMKLTGKKFNVKKEEKLDLHKRYPRLCEGCPYWHTFPILKAIAPDAIFGGDIGCNMIAGIPPHNMHDYLFCMGASAGISHGVAKATNQKVISIMGDGTFFHSGMPAVANAVYNKSKFLIVIVDNRITAMTGHQPNPGMGKTGMGEDTTEVIIEDVVKSLGVKNVKTLDPINRTELEDTVKDFLAKPEVSVIICKRICALLAKRQNNG